MGPRGKQCHVKVTLQGKRRRGPCDPPCRPLDQASCPLSLGPAETATAYPRPKAILGHLRAIPVSTGYRPVDWTWGSVCSFSVGFNHISEWGLCGKDPPDV
ncbi:unnamed protein product [Pleuronectes platessa]|uniref:Uncharacterized protein n=1 Tax=Pleuronectes platessa TaxID=8262 RepID=A0A9N7Y7W0_PLEPL|nr:unnamed protein product [Pleuronectes platessa]